MTSITLSRHLILFFLLSFFIFSAGRAEEPAFGAPGMIPHWANARKTQVGTSYFDAASTLPPSSLVWFTSSQGILTETYYPTVDQAQIKDSQFLVSDGKTFLAEERKDTLQTVKFLSPSTVQHINHDRQNRFTIEHTLFTLKDTSTLVDKVTLKVHQDGLSFYLLTNPHLNNTGWGDQAFQTPQGFLFKEGDTQLSLTSSLGFAKKSVGFEGSSDGYQDLAKDFRMDFRFSEAKTGNVVGLGEIPVTPRKGVYEFYILYHFSRPSEPTLTVRQDYSNDLKIYQDDWQKYLESLSIPSSLTTAETRLFYQRSLFTIKAHADKINPGAVMASLSVPWGEERKESPSHLEGGYHLFWPRDAYHSALALLLAGDHATPLKILKFLKKIQYQENSGHWTYSPLRTIRKWGAFPQNVWVSGRPYWDNLQLDQVGYAVLLLQHLYSRSPAELQKALKNEFGEFAIKALDFIRYQGPWSAQERWEENFGISPGSFAVATAALLVGEKLFNEREESLHWGNTARGWLYKKGDNIDTWTFTETGVYGDGRYYLRVAGCSSIDEIWNPNISILCHLSNSDRKLDQRQFLDQGFLQLSLLGLRPAGDPRIESSLEKINSQIQVQTPHGPAWYRYSFDSYGENGRAKPWPLLGSEHARYQIEKFQHQLIPWENAKAFTENILQSFYGFANEGLMVAEQVLEESGEGTDSATPLVWAHAEYIKLLWSLEKRENVENLLSW